jgi:polar amino acid transport system substrate-binding protein
MPSLAQQIRIPLLSVVIMASVLAALLLPTELLQRPEDALERIQRTGVIRIGYSVQEPYAYISSQLDVIGECADTAKLVTQRMGITKIEWIQVPFSSLIPELLAGRFDVIAAGFFVTPSRRALVNYSAPSLRVASGLLVPKSVSAPGVDLHGWVERSRYKIAVQEGATEGGRLRALGLSPSRAVVVSSITLGVDALRTRKADALALSWPTIQVLQRRMGAEYQAIKLDPSKYDEMAFAFSPSQDKLLRAWDQAQRVVLGSPQHLEAMRAFGLDASDIGTNPGATP